MVNVGLDGAFVDLRRLSVWFATLSAVPRAAFHIERIVQRLGSLAVPLLGRELTSREAHRRDAARVALAHLATGDARPRVVDELRRIASSDACDECKVSALGLLAELGERGAARFADPSAIQRRSAVALAAQLDSAAEVAAAAELMLRQLEAGELLQLVGVIAEVAPAAAHRIAMELCARVDVDDEMRDEVAAIAPAPAPGDLAPPPSRGGRTHATVLVRGSRTVVIASRKIAGERRWRRWAVLLGSGRVEDCVHDDEAGDTGALIAGLVDDGYERATDDLDRARMLIAAAAAAAPEQLPPAYYLGRDLLELGDAHLGARYRIDPPIARAIELLGDGDTARAERLLARCDPRDPDVAAALAACSLADARPRDAIPQLERAIAAEPDWPLHHWNLASACHALGDVGACYHALRKFVATSDRPTGLAGDPDQPGRVALALRVLADLERTARLTGTSLRRKRRRAT